MPLGDCAFLFSFSPFGSSPKGSDRRVIWISQLLGDRCHAFSVSFSLCDKDRVSPVFPRDGLCGGYMASLSCSVGAEM